MQSTRTRRWMILGGIILVGVILWLVTFLIASQLLGREDVNRFLNDLNPTATPTQRPTRSDVPELNSENIPTSPPTLTSLPSDTPTFTPTTTLTFTPRPTFQLGAGNSYQQPGTAATMTPFPTLTPVPTETIEFTGYLPVRLSIESVGLNADVVAVLTGPEDTIVTPRNEIGYYAATAKIGIGGNTVMVGHVYPGRVFNKLLDVEIGDIVQVMDEEFTIHYYQIQEIIRFPFEDASPEDLAAGLDYMYNNDTERLTLVTCYPEYTWTHRFVVRAVPIPAPGTE